MSSPQSENDMRQLIKAFIIQLEASQFKGEINFSLSTRLVMSTDNSVYQLMPELILFPKSETDISNIFSVANQDPFNSLYFSLRGGGTGTNGQSLSDGIIIDCSKFMNHIKELNLKEEWVIVEPGVVLDQLNKYLEPHGYFFPISISTSSRATLGGMVSTNACGKGSTFYGRTQDQVINIKSVLTDGTLLESEKISNADLEKCMQCDGMVGNIYRTVHQTVTTHQAEIEKLYPNLPRMLTGYGLKSVVNKDKTNFDLNAILAGSEGTLCAVTEIKLKVTKKPLHKILVILQYATFESALADAKVLLQANPEAIETVDGRILTLAKTDILYPKVKVYIESTRGEVQGLTLVEFVGDSAEEVDRQALALLTILDVNLLSLRLQVKTVRDVAEIGSLWELRKKSVGLLGKTKSFQTPVSGVEDTLVPPERLAEYIMEFRAILDSEGLEYGMFGHVDAGCLHVRPALNLSDDKDKALYYTISDKVATLVQKYNGIMWGEHGKGFRSQYVPETFGQTLFAELCKIKQAFDPRNRLNPGKIATPLENKSDLIAINVPKLRGDYNREIKPSLVQTFSRSLHCNGNGECFNVDATEVMCPSYKVTRDRVHSPKGRATLLREWLRLESTQKSAADKFSGEVFDAMNGCLGCGACKTKCPVQIDVPSFKSKFLSMYYKNHSMSLRDKVSANSEKITLYQSKYPRISNIIMQNFFSRWISKTFFKIDDLPTLSAPSFKQRANQEKIKLYSADEIIQENPKKSVVLVSDWITSCYEAELQISIYKFLSLMGFNVFVLEGIENGEPLNLKGCLQEFKQVAKKSAAVLLKIQQHQFPLLGIEPSMTLVYANQYTEVLPQKELLQVNLVQHWLAKQEFKAIKCHQPNHKIFLILHCSEKTANSEYGDQWLKLFQKFGLEVELVDVGCCGMAGMYGHEVEHVASSKALFKMSWEAYTRQNCTLLATGYSCRAQIRRCTQQRVLHPIDFLLSAVKKSPPYT